MRVLAVIFGVFVQAATGDFQMGEVFTLLGAMRECHGTSGSLVLFLVRCSGRCSGQLIWGRRQDQRVIHSAR
jgi:hypothetical protein